MRPNPQWLNPKHFPVGTTFHVENGAWEGEVAESPSGPILLCKDGNSIVNIISVDQLEDDYTVLTIPVYPEEGHGQ